MSAVHTPEAVPPSTLCIVVVAADPDARRLMSRELLRRGYQVMAAPSAERALLMIESGLLEPSAGAPRPVPGGVAAPSVRSAGGRHALEDIERDHILRTVESCGNNLSEAARQLAIGRTTLYRKLQRYGVIAGAPV